MPNIRGQTVLSDGWEVDTTDYGKRRVRYEELGGNDLRLTFWLNDVQVSQQTLNNPSLTTIYTTVAAGLFPGSTTANIGKTIIVDGTLHISVNIITRNPLVLNIFTSNGMPPAGWDA